MRFFYVLISRGCIQASDGKFTVLVVKYCFAS